MTLTIEKRRLEPDMIVLAVSGKLTLGRESQQVERLVEEIIRDNERKVILDLSGLELIDSTGVGIVALCSGKLRQAGGELRVAGAHGMVQEVFKVVRMGSITGVYATVAAAAENFTLARTQGS